MIIVLIGIIAWLFYLLSRLNSLDAQVKNLSQELLKLKHQLSPQAKNPPQEVQETPPVVVAPKKPLAEVINESLGSAPPELRELPQRQPLQASAPPQIASQQTQATPTKPRPPITASAPRTPNGIARSVASLASFFTQGNPIVRVGMVVLFLGVSFLVKYAAGQGLLPIELRLTAVIVIAAALLILGWKTRARAGGYGLVLQGGGIAVIYLTLFAAAKLYGLIPLAGAFGLLFAVVMLGVALALVQNAQVLAILATAGGFLAPILTSSGSGSHVGLFSFYLILNLGILAIALYKTWRLLNWVGFMFTFVITSLWGVLKYSPEVYASTQPFLAAFFVLYLTVAILFSLKQPANLKGLVDGSLVFGLPLIAFGLQTALLKHTQYGLALSALALAVIYIALAYGLARQYKSSQRVLIEAFLALGIGFATLAIPLALDASWTGISWALEACGLIWVGLRQERLRPRSAGYLLQAAAAFSLVAINGVHTGDVPIIRGDFLALVLLAVSSFTTAYLLHIYRTRVKALELMVASLALMFGTLWWMVAGIIELRAHTPSAQHFAGIIIFAALSAQVMVQLGLKLTWPQLNRCVFALLPFLILFCVQQFIIDSSELHPAQGFNSLAIILALAVGYRFLWLQQASDVAAQKQQNVGLTTWHVFTAWWLFGLIFWEIAWQQQHVHLHGTGAALIWFAAISLPIVALLTAAKRVFWPFNAYEEAYKNWVPAPLFLLATLWFIAACHKTGAAAANYVPLLNPLDLAQCAVILVFAYAAKEEFLAALGFSARAVQAVFLGLLGFIWINVVVLRAVGHYQQIPYELSALWQALPVQKALSILWTACALLVMNLSRRWQQRQLWILGAGLLAVVVIKLAAKDLSGSGTLAGIISFMVVGALMLLIGYLSPIPAKRTQAPNHE
ncbi:MAG TPA: DUF2339 domain-containing protein [Cellvibrionaceae bacterium]|nr:DUF2339 domain-containing protein [Cellvibrionaceae bacterium]